MPIIKPEDDHNYSTYDYDDPGVDDDVDFYDETLEYQDWCEWYRQDLMNMWMGIRTYTEDLYLRPTLLGDMQFDDFCHYIYSYASKCPHRKSS